MLIDDRGRVGADIVHTDVCVIGAGPAGITFAREFLGSDVRVTVLESGLFGYDESAQRLADGTVDSYYFDENAIADGRRRQFGGTANLWIYETTPDDARRYARSVPAEPIDFLPRAGRPDTGWPLTFGDLEPYYQRAQTVWNGAPFDYRVDTWQNDDARPVETPGSVLTTRICQHGPGDVFALRYRDDLLDAENIDVHLGCTAVAFTSDSAGNGARTVEVAGPRARRFSVSARYFILACGGVENAQLLLSSDFTRPGSVGNEHDNIGRYITSHPEFRMGSTRPVRREVFDELALYDVRWVGRHMVSAFLTISDDVKRSEALLNMSVGIIPRGAGFGTDAHHAMASFGAARRRGERQSQLAGKARAVVSSPRDAIGSLRQRKSRYYEEWRGGWSTEPHRPDFEVIELWAAPEQSADRQNRLTLSDQRDPLGRNRVQLNWHWSQTDRENIQRSVDTFASQVEAIGLGRFESWNEFEGPARPRQEGLHHPMGATRMHFDPRLGAVDENCRLHGLSNVYVAGSSVFSSGLGYANPTLTLLALTTRLADHVKAEAGALAEVTPLPRPVG